MIRSLLLPSGLVPSSSEIEPLLVNWWTARTDAATQLAIAGRAGTGAQARSARHMQSAAEFVRKMFIDAGLAPDDVVVNSAVPGYFRRSKEWDVVAMRSGHLVGVVELKSQGSSPGNNANNRIEEALGSAFDMQTVQDLTQAFGSLGAWAAWGMIFNRDAERGTPVPMKTTPVLPIDRVYQPMTYATQYATAIERFIARNVYQAGWMVITWLNPDGSVGHDEPVPTATATTLRTQIEARVRFAMQALP